MQRLPGEIACRSPDAPRSKQAAGVTDALVASAGVHSVPQPRPRTIHLVARVLR